MRHLDLFSGIGGFALAASWVWKEEYETIAFVEREEYCQRVLRKNFPGVPICEDIYEAKGEDYTPVDLLTGGFPCQPFSVAGKQRGKEDDRYLWPEMLRVIREARPSWIIGENVDGIVNMGLDEVLFDLESEGYKTRTFIIPACAVDAPHRRARVWIVANPRCFAKGTKKNRSSSNQINSSSQRQRTETGNRSANLCQNVADTESSTERSRLCKSRPAELRRGRSGNNCCKDNVSNPKIIMSRHGNNDDVQEIWDRKEKGGSSCAIQSAEPWPVEPSVGRVANGIPSRVDRLRGLGNAIVPQIAAVIMQTIKDLS